MVLDKDNEPAALGDPLAVLKWVPQITYPTETRISSTLSKYPKDQLPGSNAIFNVIPVRLCCFLVRMFRMEPEEKLRRKVQVM